MVINPQTLRGIYVAFNTIFNKALTEVQPLYTEIASVIPSTTESETYAWLGDIPGMREWIGDREVQNLTASSYVIRNKDFELTVGVDRNAIEDDKLGLYNVSIQMLAQSAAAHPDELIFKLLASGFTEKCFDGQPFFSATHKIGEKTVSNMSHDRSNAFRVSGMGVYGKGAFNSSGADYAELFEWLDGNPDKEDRVGRFVTLDDDRIRLATPGDDYILGVVSGNPSVVGDVYDDQWAGMFVLDVYGRPVYEWRDFPAETMEVPDENGGMKIIEIAPACRKRVLKLNPDYDPVQTYVPRTQRPEWAAVGLLGKLVALDDGTCQPNGWAAVDEGGIATASVEKTKYRVMSRLDEGHVRVMIL